MTPDKIKPAWETPSHGQPPPHGPAKAARRTERRGRGEALDLACTRLMGVVQKMGPNARLPGLRELREQIGVSQGTLNAALDYLEGRRVLLRRERSGVFVAADLGRRNVCLICSLDFFLRSNGSPFWQLLLQGIQDLAEVHGTHLTLSFAGGTSPEGQPRYTGVPPALPAYLREEIALGNFEGVFSVGLPEATTRWIEEQGVPVVAFAGRARYMVTTARLPLVWEGTAALAGAGCERTALWLPSRSHWVDNYSLIANTFVRATDACGVSRGVVIPSAAEVAGFSTDGVYYPIRVENGWEYAHRFFGPDVPPEARPDGVLISDDMLGQGVLMGFLDLGIVVGKDVQVACYANAGSPTLLGWEKHIFRVEYDIARLIEIFYETLEALMREGKNAASGAFVPPFDYDVSEYPVTDTDRYRLVRPTVIPPAR